jgi:hypothetical protein
MNNQYAIPLLSVVSFVCVPTHIAYCKSLADYATGSDLQTFQRVVADAEFWGIEIYNCTCQATISQESTTTGKLEQTINYYGNRSATEGVYTRYDIRQPDGTTIHNVSTPRGSFSGVPGSGGKTALTNMTGGLRAVSVIDQFVMIAVVPIRQVLTDSDVSVKSCDFTKFSSDSRDAIRIRATLDFGDIPWDLMVEFTDYGRYVMTRYDLKLMSAQFSGAMDYGVIEGRPAPRGAAVVQTTPNATTKTTFSISHYKFGAVSLDKFEPEAIGIEMLPPLRPRAYWIVLISLGALILIATLIRLKRHDAKSKTLEEME